LAKPRPDSRIIPADCLPYRPCVGIMVLNRDGLVWAGHRIVEPEGEVEGAEHLWQMPQGGIDRGETALQAATRELYEETGMKTVSLIIEASHWINYDLPAHLIGIALKGKFRGQTQKWFAFRFEGDESEIEINPPPGGNSAEFDLWEWKNMRELPELIVPFKRHVYDELVSVFGHLAGTKMADVS
jgi:putative (di)nucleoside polyphosphate hydrolase